MTLKESTSEQFDVHLVELDWMCKYIDITIVHKTILLFGPISIFRKKDEL